eukprot:TRINITY_DN12308_c0_g2_i3.p1 TRINITY_DN12308_c0_g2~~TRINITY_DN12308_c0_g2_i3.p1  ORF type:complete len:490 (-),score=83.98 TRINITY_DN12308_c0_g2_i3:60-1529(-)
MELAILESESSSENGREVPTFPLASVKDRMGLVSSFPEKEKFNHPTTLIRSASEPREAAAKAKEKGMKLADCKEKEVVKELLNSDYSEAGTDRSPLTISVKYWFEFVTGCDETTFSKTRAEHLFVDEDENLFIKNCKTGRLTKAGKFSLIMMGQMYLDVGISRKESRKQKKRHYPPIEIITTLDRGSIRLVDIGYLQTLPENRNCVFQIASNFNGVEGVCETTTPDSHKFTTKYYLDKTQGPTASVSCSAGAISRVHLAFYSPKKKPSEWGQTEDMQLNFMKDLESHFPVKNGYIVYTGKEPKFPKPNGKKWKKLIANFHVAYHAEQQVCLGHRTETISETQRDPQQTVDQVCCAAINMIQGLNGKNNEQCDRKRKKMKFALQAAYDGTYLGTIRHGRKKIFLTFVGGGAFGNPHSDIFNQIVKSHKKWSRHTKSVIEKVVLVMWTPLHEHIDAWLELLKQENVPYSYIGYKHLKPKLISSYDPYQGKR